MKRKTGAPLEKPLALHENLALTNFDSYQKCIKVGPLSLTHESKMLTTFDIRFDTTLTRVKVIRPLT